MSDLIISLAFPGNLCHFSTFWCTNYHWFLHPLRPKKCQGKVSAKDALSRGSTSDLFDHGRWLATWLLHMAAAQGHHGNLQLCSEVAGKTSDLLDQKWAAWRSWCTACFCIFCVLKEDRVTGWVWLVHLELHLLRLKYGKSGYMKLIRQDDLRVFFFFCGLS